MKRLAIILFLLVACNPPPKQTYMSDDLASIVKICKGSAVVIKQGHYVGLNDEIITVYLIRDDSNNLYEYTGTTYKINVGDTIAKGAKK